VCRHTNWSPEVLHLLFTPLPADLPTAHKDPLILSAAYYGDIDRYARLKRPEMVEFELECVVRGMYHNTMFAKWWSLQPRGSKDIEAYEIGRAVEARFIMNNDLSRVKTCSESFVSSGHDLVPNARTLEDIRRARST